MWPHRRDLAVADLIDDNMDVYLKTTIFFHLCIVVIAHRAQFTIREDHLQEALKG